MGYHTPVLLEECIEGLNINPSGVYVDVTFGGGGHAARILDRIHDGHLFGFDQDSDAARNTFDDERFTLIPQNFKYLKNFLGFYQALPVDGILADLGVSSHQFDSAERGFSTRFDGPLDSRMDASKGQSAADLVNTADFNSLARILRMYGELKNPGTAAKTIIAARDEKKIVTTQDLKSVLQSCAQKGRENKYFAQVFQALRIEVNAELDALEAMLKQSLEALKPGGRLVVMSYHSLEDRLVKNFIKSGNFEGKIEKDFFGKASVPFKRISRKPIIATPEEIATNPRARSAKLRIAEKI
ncbi:MAG: 16S rRNA (cytosine(1402)-N(4))-methyltransferase RsmH [Bacteroidales bacterium]|nr:16S rRNA (cytosine(1402)-N(4))-methyltransferase RsmH [Bacteroidales bacterium]